MRDYQEVTQKQRAFWESRQTFPLSFRKEMLKKLKGLIQKYEKSLYEAIYKDFKKSEFDTYTTEISFIYHNLDYYLKNLSSLAKPKKVYTNIANQLGSSKIYAEPYGNCLVIGAWNYPYELSLSPAISAIASGNTAIIKPSELVPNTSRVIAEIINEHFDEQFLFVAEGGIPETTELLKLKFDKIFFTGSPKVGKIVYKAAAEHLTPIVLELGGKSPVIVTKSANLEVASKRIVWGKFLNAGQTCIAPDYLLVEKSIEKELLQKLKEQIEKCKYSPTSDAYPRMVNQRNFERVQKLILKEKVYFGGNADSSTLYIEPTILHNVDWEDNIMQEEIFAPILPVLSYNSFEEVLEIVKKKEKPLSAYLFSSKKKEKDYFLKHLSFGGGCINDVVMHFSNPNLPFGGVGNSGIGNYHGKFGFETFSHQKPIIEKALFAEPNIKYPPYSKSKLKWIKRIL
ncbi:MAG: aldehyde dehydrogenase [Flavobacteriaceae bacterium]|nr:aldehyde dehydrogenase [Flavobacteriaceae bacterium]